MEDLQRKLQEKMNKGLLTKQEYKQIDKKLYPLILRIEMCKIYNPIFYYICYGLWIVLVSVLSSLLTVKILVK